MMGSDKVSANDPNINTTTTTASQWQTYSKPKAEQGWECPRCGCINAPWVRQCNCSRDNWTITTPDWICKPDWTYRPEWWKEITCNGTSLQTQLDSETFQIHPESDPKYQIGGSDYYNPMTKTWENVSSNSTNTIHNGKTNYKE